MRDLLASVGLWAIVVGIDWLLVGFVWWVAAWMLVGVLLPHVVRLRRRSMARQ